MSKMRQLPGWVDVPQLSVLKPSTDDPGWTDAAFWLAQLDAWGVPAKQRPLGEARDDGRDTTLVVPAASPEAADTLAPLLGSRGAPALLVSGPPSPEVAALLGLRRIRRRQVHRIRIVEPLMRARASASIPDPGPRGDFDVDVHGTEVDASESDGWETLARWCDLAGADGPTAIARRTESDVVWFGVPASSLDWRGLEATVACAEAILELASPRGLVAVWRWPHAKTAALVVDGDVDHPTGVDPECSRYVAPALETAARAGYGSYGIFAAAANVDAEPLSFPPAAGYYNHSYHHPYSYWDPRPWQALAEEDIEDELTRANETFLRHLGTDDEGIFRFPHFQLEGFERTYAVLERRGYRGDSSIGANVSITAGLPFHPARRPWSERPADAAYARTHPDRAGRYPFLQLPISSDPSHPDFAHGCCSYNVLAEGVRRRTAAPSAYEALLDDVVRRAVARRTLAHLFIDPPDAGYGRLLGDHPDYASAVEAWLSRCVRRGDLAVLTTSELADWWLARERAVTTLSLRLTGGRLRVETGEPPPGGTLSVLPPHGPKDGRPGWRLLGRTDEGID